MKFLKFICFNWRIIAHNYSITVMVFAIHQHESAMGIHESPHPKPPSHLPSHPIPLGCARALSLGVLLHTSNLLWSSILHLIMYMFQCYSLKSSHAHLLPLSPKVCSLLLCLLCCPAYMIVVTVKMEF